jgi:hypothetical protein
MRVRGTAGEGVEGEDNSETYVDGYCVGRRIEEW